MIEESASQMTVTSITLDTSLIVEQIGSFIESLEDELQLYCGTNIQNQLDDIVGKVYKYAGERVVERLMIGTAATFTGSVNP